MWSPASARLDKAWPLGVIAPEFWNNFDIGTKLSSTETAKVTALCKEYRNIFSTSNNRLGECKIGFHQIPTGNALLVSQPVRKFSSLLIEEIHRQLREMIEMGGVSPCESDWASNLVLVGKKTGEIQMCVDSRSLNAVTRRICVRCPRSKHCLIRSMAAVILSLLICRLGTGKFE